MTYSNQFHKFVRDFSLVAKSLLILVFCIIPTFLYGQSAKSDKHFNKGVELYESKNYAKAIVEFTNAMVLDEKELSKESSRNGYSRQWLASCYYQLGDSLKAKEISPADFFFPPVDRRLTVLSDREVELADVAMTNNDYDEALLHLRKCEEYEVSALGTDSWFHVNTVHYIGHVYSAQEKLKEALDEFVGAYELLCRHNLRNGILGYELAMDIVGAAQALNEWNLSAKYISIANDIAEAVDSPLLRARALIASGNESLLYNNYDDAKSKFCSALNLMADNYDVNEEQSSYYLCECVYALESLWAIAEIRDGLKKLMAKVEDSPENKCHWGVFLALYGRNGSSVEESIPCLERSVVLLEGEEKLKYLYYHAICDLAGIIDNPYKAIEYLENIINDEVLAFDVMIYRRALKTLADLYDNRSDYGNAVSAYEKIVQTFSSEPDPLFTLFSMRLVTAKIKLILASGNAQYNEGYSLGVEVRRILQNMGSYNNSTLFMYGLNMNDIVNAVLPLFRLLMRVPYDNYGLLPQMETILTNIIDNHLIPQSGYKNNLTLESLALLSHIRYLQGNVADAIQIREMVVEKSRENGGDPSSHIHDLAYFKYENGDVEGALDCFNVGFNFLKQQFISNFQWMTSNERTLYTNSNIGNVYNLAHYASLNANNPRYCALGYNALLFSKGLLLNSTIELSKLLQEEGDGNALRMLNEWRNICQARDRQKDKDVAEWYRLDSLALSMERQLLATSKTFGDYTSGLTIEYPEVQKNLREGDIAIEFFSYPYNGESWMYGALVLKNEGEVQCYPVGSDTSWKQFMDNAYTSSDLFNSLFSSLKDILPHKTRGTIYFSADRLLHTIGIENLCGAENYDFRRLSSTRELALKKEETKGGKDVAIFGGIKYGVGSLSQLYEETDIESVANKRGKRGSESFLKPLPGTKVEAVNIGKALSGAMNRVDLRTGEDATEEVFKSYSGKKIHVMHIATHGFFDETAMESLKNDSFDESMRYSGLYMTGAQNTLWEEAWDNHGEDGILTSQEISVQDFRCLELAVLSACETGKGAISGDGVFGLQRGFKQAGAQCILMSLWKVDDVATRLLMERFYSHLKSVKNPYLALKGAQADVRAKYPAPQYWAAFILIDGLTKINIL